MPCFAHAANRLFLHDAAGTDVAAAVIGGRGTVHLDAGAAGVDKVERLAFGIHLGYDADVADGARGAGTAEEHEVALFQFADRQYGRALCKLRARAAIDADIFFLINVAGETRAVESRRAAVTAAIARSDVLQGGAHDVFACRIALLLHHGLGLEHIGHCESRHLSHHAFCREAFRHSVQDILRRGRADADETKTNSEKYCFECHNNECFSNEMKNKQENCAAVPGAP